MARHASKRAQRKQEVEQVNHLALWIGAAAGGAILLIMVLSFIVK